jgi:hypothetical protein
MTDMAAGVGHLCNEFSSRRSQAASQGTKVPDAAGTGSIEACVAPSG